MKLMFAMRGSYKGFCCGPRRDSSVSLWIGAMRQFKQRSDEMNSLCLTYATARDHMANNVLSSDRLAYFMYSGKEGRVREEKEWKETDIETVRGKRKYTEKEGAKETRETGGSLLVEMSGM